MCRERSAKVTYLCRHTYMSYTYGLCFNYCDKFRKEHDPTAFKTPHMCPSCRPREMIRQYESDPPPGLALRNIHPALRPKISKPRVSANPPVLPETPRFTWEDDPDWPLRTPASTTTATTTNTRSSTTSNTRSSRTTSTTRPEKQRADSGTLRRATAVVDHPLHPANLPPRREHLALAYKQDDKRHSRPTVEERKAQLSKRDDLFKIVTGVLAKGATERGWAVELGSVAACRDMRLNDPWCRARFFICIDTIPSK